MGDKEIAKELAVACLSHANLAAYFGPGSTKEPDATDAGKRVGAFYNAIFKALQEESAGQKPKAFQVG